MNPRTVTTGTDHGGRLQVHEGPLVLRHSGQAPVLDVHRRVAGRLPALALDDLLRVLRPLGLRGRGGAGFPFVTKLQTAARGRGRPTVVVNLSEGEPASFKDAALALTTPHLVLDGAEVVARALGARTVHLVVPAERGAVEQAVRLAVAERAGEPTLHGALRWQVHQADPRFVAGQARAVIELMSGRENLPVTAWEPEAVRGHRGRPTLLSNAETFAHVATAVATGVEEYLRHGTPDEPGTVLLTVHGLAAAPQVVEVEQGAPWSSVLPLEVLARPVLVGGFHGTWAAPGRLGGLPVSRAAMAGVGLALGAGVVLPLAPGDCPVHRTARIADYLAGQSARRCGPCLNGLPALARAVSEVADGHPAHERVAHLASVVARRGACAHPDGTIRMVESMMSAYADEVAAHAAGRCTFVAASVVGAPRGHEVVAP